jgi:hypothetical protein
MGCPIGYTKTADKKGTSNEYVDAAGYTHQGCVSETLQSLDRDEREYVRGKGELY